MTTTNGTGQAAALSAAEVWAALLALSRFRGKANEQTDAVSVCLRDGVPVAVLGVADAAVVVSTGLGQVSCQRELGAEARSLFERYAPLCHPLLGPADGSSARCGSYVVAHLGQSLDGRIGPPSGEPEAITGPLDMAHNHCMRALFDVVLVGAGTVCHDDPKLTVRHVDGPHAVRVVVDPERRLTTEYSIFHDELAPTLLVCRAELVTEGERHGQAEVVGAGGGCSPAFVLEALRRRGLCRVFIEGGGITVSRFLASSCLNGLQIAVSPLIMGQGLPGLDLGETVRLRPRVRRYTLGEDVMFECCFDD